MKKFLKYVGLILSVYQIAIGYFGTPASFIHRPLSAGILLMVLFLTIGIDGEKQDKPKWYDYVLAAASIIVCAYIIFNFDWLIRRFPFVSELSLSEMIIGCVLVMLVLEAGRRALGWVMPAIAIIALLYAYFGKYMPGVLQHRGFTIANIIDQIALTTEGIWGSPTHISLTVVFMFVIFGAVLSATGMSDFFMDLALCITGGYSGGTAKTAVVSSALMGMIQGSSISNVVTTGTFTIPAMKKAGFSPTFAGAVETVASCGGQIMPPVMGAAAFIMADYTGIPYGKIIIHAIIPAILYYACCMLQVHFRSKKLNMTGLPSEVIPKFKNIIKANGVYVIPIIMVVVFLIRGYTAMRAGFIAIISLLIIALIFSKDKKEMLRNVIIQLEDIPQSMCTIITAVMNAGIIIGVLFLTGLGLRMSSLIVDLSQGSLAIALILSMLLSIVLGMGMPTSGAYIMMGTLVAPALIKLGLEPIQAHMFVFYFACMSMLTPPVAIAAYAAAGLSGANPMKTGFAAWKLALAAFIVPFMFAYGPELLLMGSALDSVIPFVTSLLGCLCLSVSIEGYLLSPVSKLEQILMFIAALLLIETSFSTDLIGLIILGVIGFRQIKKYRSDRYGAVL